MSKLNLEVVDALLFAANRHAAQGQLYGDLPYSAHLMDAIRVALSVGIADTKILVSIALHDVIEDTPTTPQELGARFSDRVKTIVCSISRDRGRSRAETVWEHASKIPEARVAKLCDRIANVNECLRTGDARFLMYQGEHKKFRTEMRPDFDRLALGWMFPNQERALWRRIDALLPGWDK